MKVTRHKARKDYLENGIKKGDLYYRWHPKGSKWQRQIERPTQRQLTTNWFELAILDFQDRICGITSNVDIGSSREELESIITDIRELAEEQSEKIDNMPENFKECDVAELIRTRENGLNEWADELESAAGEINEEMSEEEFEEVLQNIMDVEPNF